MSLESGLLSTVSGPGYTSTSPLSQIRIKSHACRTMKIREVKRYYVKHLFLYDRQILRGCLIFLYTSLQRCICVKRQKRGTKSGDGFRTLKHNKLIRSK